MRLRHPVLGTPVHVQAVARAIVLATQAAQEARRGHVRLDVVADVLARAARFAAKAAHILAPVGGLLQQLIDPRLQVGDVLRRNVAAAAAIAATIVPCRRDVWWTCNIKLFVEFRFMRDK